MDEHSVGNMVRNGVRPQLEDIIPKVRSLGLDGEMWVIAARCWDQDPIQRFSAAVLCEKLNSLLHQPRQAPIPRASSSTARPIDHPGASSGLPSGELVPPASYNCKAYAPVTADSSESASLPREQSTPAKTSSASSVPLAQYTPPKLKGPAHYRNLLDSLLHSTSVGAPQSTQNGDVSFANFVDVATVPSLGLTTERPLSPKSLGQFSDPITGSVSPLELRQENGLSELFQLSPSYIPTEGPMSELFLDYRMTPVNDKIYAEAPPVYPNALREFPSQPNLLSRQGETSPRINLAPKLRPISLQSEENVLITDLPALSFEFSETPIMPVLKTPSDTQESLPADLACTLSEFSMTIAPPTKDSSYVMDPPENLIDFFTELR